MSMGTGVTLIRICSVRSFSKQGNGICAIKGGECIDQLMKHRLYV
jgi:hypothetical protein